MVLNEENVNLLPNTKTWAWSSFSSQTHTHTTKKIQFIGTICNKQQSKENLM